MCDNDACLAFKLAFYHHKEILQTLTPQQGTMTQPELVSAKINLAQMLHNGSQCALAH